MSATLTDNDCPGRDRLTGIGLHASSLTITVAPVLGRTNAFFMCHFVYPRFSSVFLSAGRIYSAC
jgi:hypothetical protein